VPDVLNDDPLDHRQVLNGADIGKSEVVAKPDVGDHRNIAAVEAEALAQHAAACRFQDGRVDTGVEENISGAFRTTAVAAVDAPIFDIDAVGGGHADAQALCGENVGDQADGGRLAVGSGNRHQRDTRIFAVGEDVADDRFANWPSLAERRLQMHAQAWCGVQLDDTATLLLERAQDAVTDDVNTGNIEADGARRSDGLRGELGMDVVGDVGGRAAGRQVGVVAQDYARASVWYRLRGQAAARQACQGHFVEANPG
jgi:hypothetical protein